MRKTPLVVLSLAVPVLTMLPVITIPAPAAQPVTPKISVTPLYGVDAAALGELLTAAEPATDRAVVSALAPAEHRDPTTVDPVVLTGKQDAAPFDLVGLTWDAADPAPDTIVSVRVREDGSWTRWETLHLEDGAPDAATAEGSAVSRVGTSPLLVHKADGLQVRVDRPGGRIPHDLRVNLVDAGQQASDGHLTPTPPARTAMAATDYPNVIIRAQWGADESLRSDPAAYNATIKAGIVHHTAGTNKYSADESAGLVRAIYAYHTRGHGWSDIGYHFLVDKFGRIYEGRAGGMDLPVRGAHAGGYNVDTVGVSAMGSYDEAPAPKVMTRAIARLLAWKLSLHNRDPYGTVALRSEGGGTARLPQGEVRDFPVIMGHRHVGMTACAGHHLMERLPAIRELVNQLISAAPVTQFPPVPPVPPAPVPDPIDRPVEPATAASGIIAHWLELGGQASVLGEVTSAEFAVPGGAAQDFAGGRIYWSQRTGARSMIGEILRRYVGLDGTASALGFPTSDEIGTINGGTYSLMTGGKILFHPNSGAHPLWGDIVRLYDAGGAEGGTLAFPTEAETVTSTPPVVRQRFAGGAVYWSPDRGARAVVGAIFTRYLTEGAEDGSLGVPLTGEYAVPDGMRADFAAGSLIWTSRTGEIVLTR